MYHTGIVVDDLEDAMAGYSAAVGLRWAEPLPFSGLLRTPSGPLPHLTWATYSLDAPHHIELVEHIDPTAWSVGPRGPRVHHLGYIVHDLAPQMSKLQAAGFECVAHGEGDHGKPVGSSFHAHPCGGLHIELVDRRAAESFRPWFEGGGIESQLSYLAALGLDSSNLGAAFTSRSSWRPGRG
jgi:hypothetical protein